MGIFSPKKCNPLSFPILRGHDSTGAVQSSPFQKYKNLEKYKKNHFKNNEEEEKNFQKKKKKLSS